VKTVAISVLLFVRQAIAKWFAKAQIADFQINQNNPAFT
jgi:hypothetical protein